MFVVSLFPTKVSALVQYNFARGQSEGPLTESNLWSELSLTLRGSLIITFDETDYFNFMNHAKIT